MSDLSIYELEDIIWDDFDRSDDHIVPHTCNDDGSENKCDGNSCKKPRREETPLHSSAGNLYASGSVCQVKEERDSTTLNKKRNMKENDPWSHTPDGVAKETTGLQSDDTRISNDCFGNSNVTSGSELCMDDRILNETSAAADSNSYNYSLSHIHQTGDLNLFSNECDEKESSDLLYYGWPDIGNFGDVDRMLSNCDSSFGLGVTGNDDELVWFTSEDPAGGYDEALKMDLKFPCSEPSSLTQDHEPPESDNKRSSYISESKDELKLKDQKNQSKHQHQTESTRQKTKNSEHDSFGYMQSNAYLNPDYDHVPRKTIDDPMMAGIKSESKGITSPSVESSGDCLFQGTGSEVSERRKAHQAHAFQPSFSGNQKQMGMMLQASTIDLGSSQKQLYMPENKLESQNDMEGVTKGASAETGSVDVPEGSSISSELDEISLEATSFRQLQQVMEQLDTRTKLCIRDSLYRLARSAEQRHNYAGICNGTANYGGTQGPLTEGTNKCTGFMDMETDTNPIDRTIAHLLFHRPLDSSNMPLKPNAKAEAANESDDKISGTRKN